MSDETAVMVIFDKMFGVIRDEDAKVFGSPAKAIAAIVAARDELVELIQSARRTPDTAQGLFGTTPSIPLPGEVETIAAPADGCEGCMHFSNGRPDVECHPCKRYPHKYPDHYTPREGDTATEPCGTCGSPDTEREGDTLCCNSCGVVRDRPLGTPTEQGNCPECDHPTVNGRCPSCDARRRT